MFLREVAVVPAFESSSNGVDSYSLFIELFYKDEFSRKQNEEKILMTKILILIY